MRRFLGLGEEVASAPTKIGDAIGAALTNIFSAPNIEAGTRLGLSVAGQRLGLPGQAAPAQQAPEMSPAAKSVLIIGAMAVAAYVVLKLRKK